MKDRWQDAGRTNGKNKALASLVKTLSSGLEKNNVTDGCVHNIPIAFLKHHLKL